MPAAEEPGDSDYNLIVRPFFIGDTLYDVMFKMKDSILPEADLESSYIIRNSEDKAVPVNLLKLLYDYDLSYNHPIESFDRIMVPHKSMYVMINGDVRNPGNYHFVPQRKYSYYLRLAGGTLNGGIEDTVIIYDKHGNIKTPGDDIESGDNINIKLATVILSGAITTPGEYPFLPGKLYTYYINLAGGINYDRNDGGDIVIKDKENNRKKKSDIIAPGDTIFLPSSSFTFSANRIITILSTAISIAISSFIIWDRFFAE